MHISDNEKTNKQKRKKKNTHINNTRVSGGHSHKYAHTTKKHTESEDALHTGLPRGGLTRASTLRLRFVAERDVAGDSTCCIAAADAATADGTVDEVDGTVDDLDGRVDSGAAEMEAADAGVDDVAGTVDDMDGSMDEVDAAVDATGSARRVPRAGAWRFAAATAAAAAAAATMAEAGDL